MPQPNLLSPITRIWIFDVDGVITDPQEKRVTEKGLLKKIAERLETNEAVCLNTGRSLNFMMEQVIKPLEEELQERNKLANFMAVGEKGGCWLLFEEGTWKTHIDESIRVPSSLQREIKQLINTEFSDSMFYDDSKLTMISTEMRDCHSIAEYTEKQPELVIRMKQILQKPEYQKLSLTIDPTTIATDIQNSHVGKHLGARRIATWLTENGIQPQKIITIGDSQSDIEMAEELQNGYAVTFVFVGDPAKLKATGLKKNPIFTKKRFAEGTMEYLTEVS